MQLSSRRTLVQLHVLVAFSIVFFGNFTNANKKKVVLQFPKKQNVGGKQIHHHHHYLLMDPVTGGSNMGPYDHAPRPPYSQGPNNMRLIYPDVMNHAGFPHHVPIYLGQSPDTHGEFIDPPYHRNHLRNPEPMMFPAVPPPPPTSSPPQKLKIIRKTPMKMEGTTNEDYFSDVPFYQMFSDEQPIVNHKPFPEFFHRSGYNPHNNYNPTRNSYAPNPQSIVQHIYTEEVQTDYK